MTRTEQVTVPDATIRGVDVSKWQDPDGIRWDVLAQAHRFAIVRACYGAKSDARFLSHVRHARDAGMAVGAYGFYRYTDPTPDQYLTLSEQMDRARMGPGDIAPSWDCEDDPNVAQVSPVWSEPLRLLCDATAGKWSRCIVYGNANDLARLGNPEWLGEHALWVAHWTRATQPLCPPGLDWSIWQHRVSVIASVYPSKLDQNLARLPLPTIRDEARFVRNVEQQIATTLQQTIRGLPRP